MNRSRNHVVAVGPRAIREYLDRYGLEPVIPPADAELLGELDGLPCRPMPVVGRPPMPAPTTPRGRLIAALGRWASVQAAAARLSGGDAR